MKKVAPIRDKNKIQEMKAILKRQNYRDYLLFDLGINIGLRISDLLQLKVKDVKNNYEINLKEKKTGKRNNPRINARLQEELNEYVTGMNEK